MIGIFCTLNTTKVQLTLGGATFTEQGDGTLNTTKVQLTLAPIPLTVPIEWTLNTTKVQLTPYRDSLF